MIQRSHKQYVIEFTEIKRGKIARVANVRFRIYTVFFEFAFSELHVSFAQIDERNVVTEFGKIHAVSARTAAYVEHGFTAHKLFKITFRYLEFEAEPREPLPFFLGVQVVIFPYGFDLFTGFILFILSEHNLLLYRRLYLKPRRAYHARIARDFIFLSIYRSFF